MRTDVSDLSSLDALADAAYGELGAVHVLCNNAGVLVFGAMQDLKVDDWRWVLGVNVFGVLNGIYTFLPRMLESGAPCHVVNTGSIASLAGHGVYGVSKAAILNITETLRADLEGTNVGVTALLPGMLNTRIVAAQRNRPAEYGEKAAEPFGSEPVSYGVDPSYCGRRVREAILANELYVFAGIPEGTDDGLRTGPPARAAACSWPRSMRESSATTTRIPRCSRAPRRLCVGQGTAGRPVARLDEPSRTWVARPAPASSGSSRSRPRSGCRGRRSRPTHPHPCARTLPGPPKRANSEAVQNPRPMVVITSMPGNESTRSGPSVWRVRVPCRPAPG